MKVYLKDVVINVHNQSTGIGAVHPTTRPCASLANLGIGPTRALQSLPGSCGTPSQPSNWARDSTDSKGVHDKNYFCSRNDFSVPDQFLEQKLV